MGISLKIFGRNLIVDYLEAKHILCTGSVFGGVSCCLNGIFGHAEPYACCWMPPVGLEPGRSTHFVPKSEDRSPERYPLRYAALSGLRT